MSDLFFQCTYVQPEISPKPYPCNRYRHMEHLSNFHYCNYFTDFTILLFHYFTILLFHYFTILLFYYFTILLFHYFTILPFYCFHYFHFICNPFLLNNLLMYPPTRSGISEFFLLYMYTDNGTHHTGPTTSPENSYSSGVSPFSFLFSSFFTSP